MGIARLVIIKLHRLFGYNAIISERILCDQELSDYPVLKIHIIEPMDLKCNTKKMPVIHQVLSLMFLHSIHHLSGFLEPS